MPPALVLFDLDGTLVDSLPDIASALGAVLTEIGLTPPPLDVVKRMVGDGARELVRRALADERPELNSRRGRTSSARPSASPGSPRRSASAGWVREVRNPSGGSELEEATFQRFLARYRAHVCVDSRLYPGAAETVAALREDGVALAVVTNKPGDLARRLLEGLGLAPHLDAIIGDGDGFPRKPDPAAALSLMARIGASPARTVVVGDGLPDMRLGRALGATTIGATWGYVPEAALAAEAPAALADSLTSAARLVRDALAR